jgi:autotransporter-associated beta strand protein
MLEATGELVHRIEIPLQFDANVQISGDGGATFDFCESLGGSAGLVKSGSSRFTLSVESDYTGFTSIQSGILRASHAGALGTTGGSTTVQCSTALATFELSGGIYIAEPLQLVMHNTPGHIQLRSVAGDNLQTSPLSLNSGGGRWDISCQDGFLTVAGPVVNISGGTDTWRTLYLHGPAGCSFTHSMSDSASGNSKLNVNVRSGRWHFGNASKSYTGITVVSGGWLEVDSSLTSAITVQSGGTFSGSGSTSRDLIIETGASIAVRPGDWASAPGVAPAPPVRGSLGGFHRCGLHYYLRMSS